MKREDPRPMPPALRKEIDRRGPDARRSYEQVWHLLGRAAPAPVAAPSDEQAWAELQGGMASPSGDRTDLRRDRAPVRYRRRLRPGSLVLLALAAVVLLGIGLWRQPVTVYAPPGDFAALTLPDGSVVELNSGTRLRYRRGFAALPLFPARSRTVSLEGEAFFRVARSDRPFRVQTFNARIEVLGTAFNVWARREAPVVRETRVTLSEGRVRVTAERDPDHPLVLEEAGTAARVRNGADAPLAPAPLQAVPLDRALAWRTRGFAVVDQPIPAILQEVARRYALSIEIQEGLALTGSMGLIYQPGVTAEEILHDLCLAQGCRYRKTSRGFVLVPGD